MDITQEAYDEAILEVTGGVHWDTVKKGLANEIYHAQARALDAESWEQVCRLKGFAEGIAYVMRLREITKASISANV
ncbi:MAG: hypothetical protein GTO49_17210 [Anaerolineae bacterium]|nr:hypothetical protein [Anaerolineae bacterium]